MLVNIRRQLSLLSFMYVINVIDDSLYKKTNIGMQFQSMSAVLFYNILYDDYVLNFCCIFTVDILGAIVKVGKVLHTNPIKNKFWDIKSERIIFFKIRDLK